MMISYRNRLPSVGLFVLFILLLTQIAESTQEQEDRWYWMERTYRLFSDPHIVIDCIKEGRWPGSNVSEESVEGRSTELTRLYGETYRIARDINPYFQHGDFDGDSELDVAITVRETSTGHDGVVILLTASEEVFLFGFGEQEISSTGDWDISFLHVRSDLPRESLEIGLSSRALISLTWDGRSFRRRIALDHDPTPPEPDLLVQARSKGLWPADGQFRLLTEYNPVSIRGDFDGDRVIDLAVQVHDTVQDQKGIIFIHSTLDSLREVPRNKGINAGSYLRVHKKGKRIKPFSDLPPEYVIAPFTLTTDAVEVGHPGQPYCGLYHWFNGGYRWVTLFD